MSISATIKSVQDIMRQDAGVDGDAQRISQLVWMLFLKVFDSKEKEWDALSDDYTYIIPDGLRWSDWAEDDEGITGDELIDFVNNTLFKTFKDWQLTEASDPKAVLVKSLFEDSYNYMKSGTLFLEDQQLEQQHELQRYLSDYFQVSMEAMGYRLDELKLV